MAQIPDTQKLERIRIALAGYDLGHVSTAMLVDLVRWALDQEDVSDADMAAAVKVAQDLRNSGQM